MSESTALALFEDVRKALEPFDPRAHTYLIPTALQARSDLYRPAAIVVQVDPTNVRDVYDTPGSGGKTVCLHARAIERIANAGGLDFDPRLRAHTHDPKEPYVCDMSVGGYYTDGLGERRLVTASAKMDLRDGSPRSKIAASPKQLEVARQFICEQNESRARSRCTNKTMGLPSSFTRDELKKPFVAIRWRLDERDPEVRRAKIAAGTAAAGQVFDALPAPRGETIDAGRVGDTDDLIEGDVKESREDDEPGFSEPAQPTGELSDEQKADSNAHAVDRMKEIYANIEKIRDGLAYEGKSWRKETREKKVSSAQYAMVGTEILKALRNPALLEGKNDAVARVVRRAILTFARGAYEKWEEVTNEQGAGAIEWAKANPDEVAAVFAFLLEHDPKMAPVVEWLGGTKKK